MPTLQNSSEILRKERFPEWMNASRISQILVAIVILGLDGFVIDFWNTRKFILNSILNDAIDVNTFLNDSPFTGLVMFSVSFPTGVGHCLLVYQRLYMQKFFHHYSSGSFGSFKDVRSLSSV